MEGTLETLLEGRQGEEDCNEIDFCQLKVNESFSIRKMKIADTMAFHLYRSDEDVEKYQSWSNYSIEEASIFVNRQMLTKPNVPGEWLQLAICETASDKIVGDVAFQSEQHQPEVVQVGITISPEFQRKGIASVTISALLDYLFRTLRKHRVVSTVDGRNIASLSLFRRLGFRQEGYFLENTYFKGEWGSEVQFAMLRKEWCALD